MRFLVVGGLSAAVDLGLLVALRELAAAPLPLATTVAFWTALLVNFGLNWAWAFGAGGSAAGAPFLRYMVLVGINYLLTLLIVTGGVALGAPYPLAKVAALAFGAMWTFVAYDRWVFAGPRTVEGDAA